MCFHQRVLEYGTIDVVAEYLFALEYHSSHAKDGGRYYIYIVFADILMTVRTDDSAFVVMNRYVELCSMLDNGQIQRRQQYAILIPQLGNGNDQQTMIFTGIAAYYRRAGISPFSIGADVFALKRFIQIRHERFVEFEVTHRRFVGFLYGVLFMLI